MRILFLSDNFPPEVNAPASRTYEHCREWVKAGCQVTVITCAPNFPTGKVFEGYANRLWAREVVDGIEVIRVWSFITANEGFLKRTLDYLSFMVTATLASLFVPRPDVIVATSPQFFCACAGWLTSILRWRPYVFELRDIWPESIRAVGAMKNELVFHLLEKIELFLYRRAARVVAVTRSFPKLLAARGIDPAKIDVITNGVDLSQFSPQPKDAQLTRTLGLEGTFVAGYVGTHGMAHALETVLEAARIIAARPDAPAVRFLLLGHGAAKAGLVEKARAMNLSTVTFLESVPRSEVARYWSLLDCSIIHLRRTELFTSVIPSKLFECMAMGLPVLHGVQGESAEIVEHEKVGIVFPSEDAVALADNVLRLAANPELRAELSRNGLAAAPHYDRRRLARSMLAILGRLVPLARRPVLDKAD